MAFRGPLCEAANIKITDLNLTVERNQSIQLNNGIVIELFYYSKTLDYTLHQFIECLKQFNENVACLIFSTLLSRVNSVIDKKKKLCAKKKKL
mgnify:CR=1 FL=1